MKPNITQAAQAFNEWRANRTKRSHTPAHLKDLAVVLVDHYPMTQICDLLSINTRSIKAWSQQQKPAQAFVTLADEEVAPREVPTDTGVQLKIFAPGGLECHLSGDLPAPSSFPCCARCKRSPLHDSLDFTDANTPCH